MITQQDIDNAKAARDAAAALREAYWNGNPDGNYSVLGWMQELQKCDSQNGISRDANLNLISNALNKGGCSTSNFNLRVSNLKNRIKNYNTALSDWAAKDKAYQKLLSDFATQSSGNLTQAQANVLQSQSLKPKLYFAAVVIIVIVASVFIYLKWFKK